MPDSLTGFPIMPTYIFPNMPSYGYPNMCDSYSNQVFLNDTTGLNLFTPPYNSGMDFGIAMNDSIFNCTPWSMPNCNYNFNNDSYYQNMNNHYDKMMESQIKYQQNTRTADITLNADPKNMRQKGLELKDKIELNEQEQIMPAFRAYVDSVRKYYGNHGTEEDLKNTALEFYYEQHANTIQKDLRTKGSDSFWHGFKQVGLLGLGDNVSAEQNIAKITGQPQGKKEKIKKSAGNAAAGAGLGIAAAYAAPKIPFIKSLFKSGKSPKVMTVMAIGAAAGWLYGKVLDSIA